LYEEKQMTAIDTRVSDDGASSRAADMWDQADWTHMEAEVRIPPKVNADSTPS
jgi:RNA-directed DNA polymerase